MVAVGMAGGSVCVVSLLKPQLDLVKELKPEGPPGSPVTAVKFSPNGKLLAALTDRSDRSGGADGGAGGGGTAGNEGGSSAVVFYDCENTASPGGAFTLKSKVDLQTVADAAARAAPQPTDGARLLARARDPVCPPLLHSQHPLTLFSFFWPRPLHNPPPLLAAAFALQGRRRPI